MNSNNRVIQPGRLNVETTYVSGPLAQPTNVVIPASDGVKVLVLGGLTKFEALAGQIAVSMIPKISALALFPDGPEGAAEIRRFTASHAVDMAEAILAECASRAASKQNNQGDE